MQASLSITNSQSLLRLMSTESVDQHPTNPFSSCLQSFPGIRLFSNESTLHIREPKYWSFSFSSSPSTEYLGLISFRIDWVQSKRAVQTLPKGWANHLSHSSGPTCGHTPSFTPCKEQACPTSGSQQARDPVACPYFPWRHQRPW